jgi:predicted dithiol-disulfide oxidoreductase (DUF899 family)
VSTHIEDLNAMNHSVVSEQRWLAERKALLAREKALTQLQDQVARERRAALGPCRKKLCV